MRESDFIEWIRRQGGIDPAAVPVGPGDDCAIVKFGGEKLLVTTDQVLDGVHFILAEHGPEAAGRKALARNLSDVAAMAALPVCAVASVALPKGFNREDAEAIYHGLRSMDKRITCPIVGGDIATWDGPLAITVTVFARRAGKGKGIKPILRSGARVGDAICVTGAVGGAWKSLRHLTFTPRITEAVQLAMDYVPRAMIDMSDGLAADLAHICKASGVGAEIMANDIPIHSDVDIDMVKTTGTKRKPSASERLAAALGDGEDYELLFTLPPGRAKRLCQRQPLPVKVTNIGRIIKGAGLEIVYADGKREPLKVSGWEHKT